MKVKYEKKLVDEMRRVVDSLHNHTMAVLDVELGYKNKDVYLFTKENVILPELEQSKKLTKKLTTLLAKFSVSHQQGITK